MSSGHTGGFHSTPLGLSNSVSWWGSHSSPPAIPNGMTPFPSTGAGFSCASSTHGVGVLWGVGDPTPEPMEVSMTDAADTHTGVASSMGAPPVGQSPPMSTGWGLTNQQSNPHALPPPPPRPAQAPACMASGMRAPPLAQTPLISSGAAAAGQSSFTSPGWGLASQQGDPCPLPPPPPRPLQIPTGSPLSSGAAAAGQSPFTSHGWALASRQTDPTPLPPPPPRQSYSGSSVFCRLGPKST